QLAYKQNQLMILEGRLAQGINNVKRDKQFRLENAGSKLGALSPLNTLGRGYSIVTKGDSTTDVVTQFDQVKSGDTITARLLSGKLTATVNNIEPPEDG
ncbi:MAG: exodeoxyribonuclease VII large subunit, partial [Patiriisocius sp.]